MSLKEGGLAENYKGGVINIEATVPEECRDKVQWDLDSMAWASNARVLEGGTKFLATYSLSEKEVTIPGKQTLVLVLAVKNASNGTRIDTDFKMWLEGNDQTEKITLSDEETTIVSAAPRYNIQIQKNVVLDRRGYFDLKTGQKSDVATDTTVNGRIQGYGVTLQLYNNNTSKKLKGIELPKGNIEFDITFEETKDSGGEVLTDAKYIPVLWDYKENTNSNTGKLGRNMNWSSASYYAATPHTPMSGTKSRQDNTCYDGGEWTVEQTSTYTYHVTIKNYNFDLEKWHFPERGAWTNYGTKNIGTYIGAFSAGYIQTILQFPESVENTTTLYLKANMDNPHITSAANENITAEMLVNDNYINSQIILYSRGSIAKYNIFNNSNGVALWSSNGAGDAIATVGQNIRISALLETSSSLDGPIRSFNMLQKFHDKAFEIPAGLDSNSSSRFKQTSNSTICS